MGAKKKPLDVLAAADLGIDLSRVGGGARCCAVDRGAGAAEEGGGMLIEDDDTTPRWLGSSLGLMRGKLV